MKVDRNIPIPPTARVSGREGISSIYAFHLLKPGDSIAIPIEGRAKLIEAAKKWRQRYPGWEHAWVDEGDHVRLWRTA